MRKIPTLFKRDPDDMKRVLPEVTPGCEWVLAGEGVATRKYDGTCVRKTKDGLWWARREVKPDKTPPAEFVQEGPADPNTGKVVGWEFAENSGFAKWLAEAIGTDDDWSDGTYELCGPKVNGNPENLPQHYLIRHGSFIEPDVPRDFDGLRSFLSGYDGEGIVWHHPDGRMAKLKRRDFPREAS